MYDIGVDSMGIVTIVSVFMGAVITIQTSHNLVSPFVPSFVISLITRDSIIIEFAPTVLGLVLAGKIGSSIASEIGTMRVTEQIDALEIMGVNSSGYLALPKIVAAIFILPFITSVSILLGILGGWAGGTFSGVITTDDFVRGITTNFVPYNVIFALVKSLTFSYVITSVSAYHGFYTQGGALEVGKSSTTAVVYSSVIILIGDYVLTQIFLA
jgi:phospholipid/cholesterol/gamma-HCH transport system permease protein